MTLRPNSYKPRLLDTLLDRRLEGFGAVEVAGPRVTLSRKMAIPEKKKSLSHKAIVHAARRGCSWEKLNMFHAGLVL